MKAFMGVTLTPESFTLGPEWTHSADVSAATSSCWHACSSQTCQRRHSKPTIGAVHCLKIDLQTVC